MMFEFFIDTADIDYIRRNIVPLLEKCKHYLAGITTNPNAMHKIGCNSLSQWEEVLPKLCAFVTEMRGDNLGEVFVQIPNSKMSVDDVFDFAQHIKEFNDGHTILGLKIPPSVKILQPTYELKKIMPVNVTGLADCSTVLSCATYGVDYASIIPGRMEEVGIDANAHLSFLRKRAGTTEVITGSMRTIEGLFNAVAFNTIPTIGERVWNEIIKQKIDITTWNPAGHTAQPNLFSPHIDQRSTQLSIDFFKQMDELGKQVHTDWKNR